MWQTGGVPVLHRVTIVKLPTRHVVRGDSWVPTLVGGGAHQSALLVVGLPVTYDWFEMD